FLASAVGLGVGGATVSGLEAEEHARRTPVRSPGAVPGVLVRAPLAPGRSLLFEVCAEDAFRAPGWDLARFDVVFAHASGQRETALRVPGPEVRDAARHAADGSACATVARAEALPVQGEARLVLRSDAPGETSLPADVASVRLQGLATTWRPAAGEARLAAGLLGLGVLLLLLAGWLRRSASTPPEAPATPSPGMARGLLGAGLFLALLLGLELLPRLTGARLVSGGVLGRGALIIAAQIALALALALGRGPRDAFALAPPRRRARWFALSVALGLSLLLAGRVLARLVPRGGVAPVETLVAMPSGSVAFGLYALLAPLAEELFFRGFLYGAFERRLGANAATALVVVLFAVAHLAQSVGAWGAFASVALTGLVLTLLRRASGSTLAPALAHVTHNALLTWGALG
ncbi:MAG: CPBP family intramembrane glutamic endopeptidase, partial [Myxococcota bacterium]